MIKSRHCKQSSNMSPEEKKLLKTIFNQNLDDKTKGFRVDMILGKLALENRELHDQLYHKHQRRILVLGRCIVKGEIMRIKEKRE